MLALSLADYLIDDLLSSAYASVELLTAASFLVDRRRTRKTDHRVTRPPPNALPQSVVYRLRKIPISRQNPW
jgi:hypothetical protein